MASEVDQFISLSNGGINSLDHSSPGQHQLVGGVPLSARGSGEPGRIGKFDRALDR